MSSPNNRQERIPVGVLFDLSKGENLVLARSLNEILLCTSGTEDNGYCPNETNYAVVRTVGDVDYIAAVCVPCLNRNGHFVPEQTN